MKNILFLFTALLSLQGYAQDIEMVFVKGGTYTMGCTVKSDINCNDNEKPAHTVTISDFYIGKYEITQAQWMVVMGNNPSNFKDNDRLPVEMVSWDDIQEFIKKLNAKTGKNYRLPTEAEWEYAARGGVQNHGYDYSGSDSIGEVAWYEDNSDGKTHSVGTKKPNELGIYDMNGNVEELCSDWYGPHPSAPQTNPKGATSAINENQWHVRRGGSWWEERYCSRIWFRQVSSTDNRDNWIGFRLALNAK